MVQVFKSTSEMIAHIRHKDVEVDEGIFAEIAGDCSITFADKKN